MLNVFAKVLRTRKDHDQIISATVEDRAFFFRELVSLLVLAKGELASELSNKNCEQANKKCYATTKCILATKSDRWTISAVLQKLLLDTVLEPSVTLRDFLRMRQNPNENHNKNIVSQSACF